MDNTRPTTPNLSLMKIEDTNVFYISNNIIIPPLSYNSKLYRKYIAIPRYLEKRKKRIWKHDIMHLSRSKAAALKKRIGGKFSKD